MRPLRSRTAAQAEILHCTALAIRPLTPVHQADEAYQVGAGLSPVQAYLAIDDIIRIALEHGVDMIQ